MSRHIKCRRPQLTPSLKLCLKWWLEVLDLGIWHAFDTKCQRGIRISATLFSVVRNASGLQSRVHQCTCSVTLAARHHERRQFFSGCDCMLALCFVNVLALHISDGVVEYCDVQPPQEVLMFFKKRRDNQITSLELLSIAYGIYCGTRCVIRPHVLVACRGYDFRREDS